MPTSRSLRRWLRLPSRLALILGMGALSTAGARADAPDRANQPAVGDLQIRSAGGKIYFSEGGQKFQKLQLSATPQRDHLLRLLEGHGPVGIKLDRDPYLLMSSGGGSAFFWRNTKTPVADQEAPAPQDPPPVSPPPSVRDRGLAPPDQNPATDKNG